MLRVSAAKTDGISSRLARRLAQGADPDEIEAIRRDHNRAHAQQWAQIATALGNGQPPSLVAERAGVDPNDVTDLANAMRKAALGFG